MKPNIGWDRTPEQAANTNPRIVAEIVRQCWNAGAKRVIVTDVSCNDPRRCFQRSGIAEASRREGAEVVLPDPARFKDVDLQGEVLRDWPVFDPFLNADKIINVPIAKHHSLTGTTLGMKNWYGILGGPRHQLHQKIHESLVDLADFIRPTLTIIDCYRVLIRNGPTGGNLDDVVLKKTLVAGTDPVALDAYVAKAYWNLEVSSLPYLKLASPARFGNLRVRKDPHTRKKQCLRKQEGRWNVMNVLGSIQFIHGCRAGAAIPPHPCGPRRPQSPTASHRCWPSH